MAVNEKSRNLSQPNRLTRHLPGARSRKDFNATKRSSTAIVSMIEGRFPRIWFGMQRIVICGNCRGIATDWCRCAPE
jgi:hypothetical protein